jgi:hypothetical protein
MQSPVGSNRGLNIKIRVANYIGRTILEGSAVKASDDIQLFLTFKRLLLHKSYYSTLKYASNLGYIHPGDIKYTDD